MKKILLVLFLAVAGLPPSFGQDYAPFTLGRTPYFQAADSVYSLRITNAFAQGTDSVFEFNPRLVPVATATTVGGCYGPVNAQAMRNADNLFGEKVTKTVAQEYRFEFANGSMLLLKPAAPLGSSWVFSQTLQLTATMQNKIAGTVQGMSDSLATIVLSNGDSIVLSRSFGLIQARSFYSYFSTASVSQPLALVRLPEAGIGNGIHHPFQLFDFQPGDKFLYKGLHRMGFAPCYDYWTTTEVLSRNQNQDSIWYMLRKQKLISAVAGAPLGPCGISAGITLFPFDTVLFVVRPSDHPNLQSLSREYKIWPSYFSNHPSTGKFISGYNGRMAASFEAMYPDTCSGTFSSQPDAEGFGHYAEGLGLVSSYADMFGSIELVAYIKGFETFGTWAPLTSREEELAARNPLQVYPNPFTSELTLQLSEGSAGPAEITVLNLQGQRVHQQQITDLGSQSGQKIALPSLPAGLYLLQVRQGSKNFSVKIQRQ